MSHQPRARLPPAEPSLYSGSQSFIAHQITPQGARKSPRAQATPETNSITIVLVGTWEVPRAAKFEDQCLRLYEIHGSFMSAVSGVGGGGLTFKIKNFQQTPKPCCQLEFTMMPAQCS